MDRTIHFAVVGNLMRALKFDEDKEGKTELLEMVPDPCRKSDRLTAFTMGLKKTVPVKDCR